MKRGALAGAALAWLFLNSSAQGATILTRFFFDDYRDAFDTSALNPPPLSPGVLQVTRNQTSITVADTLSTPDTAGARRTTTLSIHNLYRIGDVTGIVENQGLGGKPRHIALGADPETAGTIVLDYDFTPLGSVDAGTGNDHLLLMVVASDNNQSNATLTIEDASGNAVTRNVVTELGVQLNVPGLKAVPFTDFPGVRFEQIQRIQLSWEAGVAYDAEIAFLAAGTSIPDPVPEPQSAFLVMVGLLCGVGFRRRAK